MRAPRLNYPVIGGVMRKPLVLFGLLLALLFSSSALAAWQIKSFGGGEGRTQSEAEAATLQTNLQIFRNNYSSDTPFYIADVSCRKNTSPTYYSCTQNLAIWDGDPVTMMLDDMQDHDVFNVPLTDDQCDSQYGGFHRINYSEGASSDGGSISASGCTVTPADDDDFQCYDRPDAPTGGFCYANWQAESDGTKNQYQEEGNGNITPPGTPSDDTSVPDYLTETNDTSTCSSGSVGFDGKSYCVDQSAIDNNYVNTYTPPPSSGGSSGGGSSGGGDSSGSTGGGSGSGGSSGGGSGGGVIGGGGSGTDLSGVISAINSVRDSIRSGFDGLADSITDGMQDKLTEEGENPDDLVEDAGIDDAFDEMEQSAGSVNGRLENLVKGNEIGSGADSGLTDQLKGYLPSFGGSGGCTPLQFFPGEIYAFTVDCVVFDKAKLYLSWLLYVWTVYTILDIFFATAPRRA